MISVKLQGRLGNQMFQIAAALSYAKKKNQPLHIPQVSLNEQLWPATFKRLNNKAFNARLEQITLKEKSHQYQELPWNEEWSGKNVILDGYFQSEKYFKEYRTEVIQAFNIPFNPLKGFTSIHVRRGDYLRFPDKHPAVNYGYLREAVYMMVEKGYKSFVVCSDDIPWCKEKLQPLKVSGAEFTYSEKLKPIQDLAMMQCCEHNIISNSSFSWWAAWLNPNPDKIVITPSKDNWYGSGNKHLSTEDMIPEEWIQLKY